MDENLENVLSCLENRVHVVFGMAREQGFSDDVILFYIQEAIKKGSGVPVYLNRVIS